MNRLAALPDAAAAFQAVFESDAAKARLAADPNPVAFVQRAARWLRGQELAEADAKVIAAEMGGAAGTHVAWHAAFDKVAKRAF